MNILIAEDDSTSRHFLEAILTQWGYETTTAKNGAEAWKMLQEKKFSLFLLDWMMPEMDGLELCRKIRSLCEGDNYIILLTARKDPKDIVSGLEAGADDYICKPFNRLELQARIKAGRRVLDLQRALAAQVESLQLAMAQIKTLEGILPICMYCHKIRTDKESWQRIEKYLSDHTDLMFSHGLCPECKAKCMVEEGITPEDMDDAHREYND
ncbi:Response regulator receiver domain-containing protein [Desulfatibacillum alkenivorans DSM 16219]|jgi:DNA-binding response OmpR family regulator|uniref:Response regulator receiver domain-containing protein n=1 Tax=Desulfatibacillum alkenivorans DSM 16219 TaxID=1121393 RepID=A0A1M6ZU76_9BACT|nr:response regulator transcription factor [Desulfatibacillum alkenivorans]SHL33974.1 Response regulator receiver domain-containing protein [Desulfatibacillum alkenivorans DSM 16219]